MTEQDEARTRERAQALLTRAAPLIGATISASDRTDLDLVIDDLVDVEGQMSALSSSIEPYDALLWEVRVALGALRATRWLRAGQAAEDKREALRLLRAARADGWLHAYKDPKAVMLLAALLLPGDAAAIQPGSLSALNSAFAIGQLVVGGGQPVNDLREVRALLDEVVTADPQDPRARSLANFVSTLDGLLGLLGMAAGAGLPSPVQIAGALSGLLSDPGNPGGSILKAILPLAPVSEQETRALAAIASTAPETAPEHAADFAAVPVADVQPDTSAEAEDDAPRFPDDLALLVEITVPGTVGAAELPMLIERIETGTAVYAGAGGQDRARGIALAALGRLAYAMRTNDTAELDKATQNLRTALNDPDTSADMTWLAHTIFPAILTAASLGQGNRQDAAKAMAQLQRDWTGLVPVDFPLPAHEPGGATLAAARQGLDLMLRLSETPDDEDDQALQQVVDQLAEAERAADPDAEFYSLFPFLLALGELRLATRRPDHDVLRSALEHLAAAVDASGSLPPAMHAMMQGVLPAMTALNALMEGQPAEFGDAIERARAGISTASVSHDQHLQSRLNIALALKAQHIIVAGPAKSAVLGQAIAELEQARDALTQRTNPTIAASVLWLLAETSAQRDDRALDDYSRATALTLQSLRLTADDVLLQRGTEHGLQAARAGSGRGLQAAAWALVDRRPDRAVACLELGRGLVLQAAAAAGTVPERLLAAGADDLAEQWQRASATPDDGADAPYTSDTYLSVPSDLRRQALEVLRRKQPSDSAPPDLPNIAGLHQSLVDADLDALIYLLPETENPSTAPRALLILADGTTRDLPLPGLSATSRTPFDSYVTTTAHRYAQLRGPNATRDLSGASPWRNALDELCRWAGTAVMDHVIDALPTQPTPQAPARVVLVPCGTLGLVPWQAAELSRRPAVDAPKRPLRACDLLVISYAASGAELLRSLANDRLPYDTDPVIVVDPSRTLHYAQAEASAIRHAYLRTARLMGHLEGELTEAPGTPDDVLAVVGSRGAPVSASMVQITAHGTASSRPTTSHLLLGVPGDPTDPDAQRRVPDIDPRYLTVAAVLDSSQPVTASGRCASLIVLDSCETDLTSRDYDEALTLTTAFVARGATDVIGSRWAIDDWSTAVCMVVFHHYLATQKLAPADALRAAQLWMLSPADAREAIPVLTTDAFQDPLHRPLEAVASWAAFIHQGNAQPHR